MNNDQKYKTMQYWFDMAKDADDCARLAYGNWKINPECGSYLAESRKYERLAKKYRKNSSKLSQELWDSGYFSVVW